MTISRRCCVLQLSDLHGGHWLGLYNPDTTLWRSGVEADDETGVVTMLDPEPYTPTPTAMQRWLWQCYQEDLVEAMVIADGDPLAVTLGGDLAHGDKYSDGIMDSNKANQLEIAMRAMAPLYELDNLHAVYVILGTEAHNWGEGALELEVAARMRSEHPSVVTEPHHHAGVHIGDVWLDIAHHGASKGIRSWTSGNQMRYYTRSLMQNRVNRWKRPPNVVTRGHYHSWWRELVTVEPDWHCWSVLLPAYCGITPHARKSTRSEQWQTCGAALIEVVDNGVREVHRLGGAEREIDLVERVYPFGKGWGTNA